MSTEEAFENSEAVADDAGIPALSENGRRIEHRRLERRLTKRQLAQRAGISRQQLWRVMTGKSEVTAALGARLAEVLEVDSRWLTGGGRAVASPYTASGLGIASPTAAPIASWTDFVGDRDALSRALAALPSDLEGARLKRALLNAVEDVATAARTPLPPHYFDLRREVLNGER